MCSKKVAERQASSYEQHSAVQEGLGLKMLDRLNLTGGPLTVLDLGCGTGNLTKILSERVRQEGKVVAVDPDRERLQIAKDNYSASNIEYIEADDKTFPEGQYDLVFANTVLHWVKDKRGLFERVYKNLKVGGRFAFVTFDGTPKVNHKVVRRLFEELISPSFFHTLFTTKLLCMTLRQYEVLATSVGLVKVCAEREEHLDRWKNLDDCVDKWFSGLHKGAFDPDMFDLDKFQKIKDEYGDGEVVYETPNTIVYMIFTKPGNS